MRFTKMQGCGNDYIYVDCFQEPMPHDPAGLSRAISDRHFGVGSDGLILICPSDKADARMRMFNADGSESEMCGNGIRCVAKYVHDYGLVRKQTLTIETGRGVLTLDLEVSDGAVRQVRVDMGEPIVEAERIPTTLPGNPPVDVLLPDFLEPLNLPSYQFQKKQKFHATCVSMGNPHLSAIVPGFGAEWQHEAGEIARCAGFPQGVNVELVKILGSNDIEVRFFERGVGETQSSGTGSCAAAVAAIHRSQVETPVQVHAAGGPGHALPAGGRRPRGAPGPRLGRGHRPGGAAEGH